jgi:predicted nucleic acid-binding protein
MRVLVDTNIILDVLLDRQPFSEDATALLQRIESKEIEGYVAATTLTNIFYIARRPRGREFAKQAVSRIIAGMEICPVDKAILEAAYTSNLSDFEDAVQLACALANSCDAIITRDANDFTGCALPILSAGQLLERL